MEQWTIIIIVVAKEAAIYYQVKAATGSTLLPFFDSHSDSDDGRSRYFDHGIALLTYRFMDELTPQYLHGHMHDLGHFIHNSQHTAPIPCLLCHAVFRSHSPHGHDLSCHADDRRAVYQEILAPRSNQLSVTDLLTFPTVSLIIAMVMRSCL